MRFILIFLLLTSVCFAQDIQVSNKIYNADEKYSWKDFTGRKLLDANDLEGKVIYGSCFSQEIPDTKVFPDVKDLTLINCNTDNIYLNPNWITIGCSNRRFRVQNDLRGWIIDITNKPIEVIGKEVWQAQGYSVDPKDIPLTKLTDATQIKKVAVIPE